MSAILRTTEANAGAEGADDDSEYRLVPVLEPNPKWQLLVDVLDEIREASQQRTSLVCSGARTGGGWSADV